MIFSAVALPTPGRSSSSFAEAVLMLTGPLEEAAAPEDSEDVFLDFDELDFSELDFSPVIEEEDLDEDDSLDFVLLLLTVT
jgi:hypothetical protein